MWRALGLDTAAAWWLGIVTATSVSVVVVVGTVGTSALFRALPVADDDHLFVAVATSTLDPRRTEPLSLKNVEELAATLRGVAVVAATYSRSLDVKGQSVLRLSSALVWGPYWSVITPAFVAGRGWSGDEMSRVGVITRSTAVRLFGTQDAVGQEMALGAGSVTVTGVVGDAVGQLLGGVELWLPLAAVPDVLAPEMWTHEGVFLFSPVGRVHREEHIQQAFARVSTVPVGATDRRIQLTARTYRDVIVPPRTKSMLWGVAVLSGAVYLLSLVSVVQLSLACTARRASEIRIRAALGAGRLLSLTPLLLQLSCLVGAGGIVGVVAALAVLRALPILSPATWLPDFVLAPSGVGVVASAALAIAVACAVSAGASVLFSRRSGETWSVHRVNGQHGVRGLLPAGLVLQVAAAHAALVLAWSVGSTYMVERSLNAGFRVDGVVTVRMSLQDVPVEDRMAAYRTIHEELAAMLGHDDIALANGLPIARFGQGALPVEGVSVSIDDGRRLFNGAPEDEALTPRRHRVSSRFFSILEIGVVSGHLFDEAGTSPWPVVVSEELARRYWPNQAPIGRQLNFGRLRAGEWSEPWRTVIGVVQDVRFNGAHDAVRPDVYFPIDELPPSQVSVLAIRRPGTDERSLLQALREIVPGAAVFDAKSMERIVVESMPDLYAGAYGGAVVSGVGLLLVVVSVFGSVRVFAEQRGRDCAVRLALGASRSRVVGGLMAHVVGALAWGVASGLGAVVGLRVLWPGSVPGLTYWEWLPAAYSTVIIGLLVVLAALGPAVGATRVNIASLLRAE